ncbi:MAG: hypothetical protein WCP21_09985 [Armatimonadota bacterium]
MRSFMSGVAIVVVIGALVGLGGCGGGSSVTTAPAAESKSSIWHPPATGPGSAKYAHGGFAVYKSGTTAQDYSVYTPTTPVPTTAPVVVFTHGWSWIEPTIYEDWIIHLTRKGNIVICPRWQEEKTDLNGGAFLPSAVTGIKRALRRLELQGPVTPDKTHVAYFGYSIGGVLAADLAATWKANQIPRPRVVFSVAPGTVSSASGYPDPNDVTISDFSKIPAAVLLIAMAAQDDTLVGDTLAKRIYNESTAIPATGKNYLIVNSDNHGSPALTADHYFPKGARNGTNVDALDYYALWKIGDALLDAAFRGTNRKYALGNTPEQRNMGQWPDATAVKPMTVH